MNAGPREGKRARTRRAIADAAFFLFAERGFDAVRTTDIAARAEVAPATVFTHFRTKEEIFFERGQAMNDGLADVVAAGTTTASLLDALDPFFRRATRDGLDEAMLDHARTYARILLASPALCDAHLVMDRERRQLLVAALGPRVPNRPVQVEVFASLVSAVVSAAFRERHERLADGTPVEQVLAGIDAILQAGFVRLRAAYRGEGLLTPA
jgi:AcrR family transcriptional regulator